MIIFIDLTIKYIYILLRLFISNFVKVKRKNNQIIYILIYFRMIILWILIHINEIINNFKLIWNFIYDLYEKTSIYGEF